MLGPVAGPSRIEGAPRLLETGQAPAGSSENEEFSEVLRETDADPPRLQEKQPEVATGNAREGVMLKFMDSIESELGIPPQKVVEAIAFLKPGEHEKAPLETAPQVIQNLELPPEDQARAMQLYMGMLQQLKSIDQPVKKPEESQLAWMGPAAAVSSPAVFSDPGRSARMSAAVDRKLALNESLSKMTDRFFLKDQIPRADFGAMQPSVATLPPAGTTPAELGGLMAVQPQLEPQALTPQASHVPYGADPMVIGGKDLARLDEATLSPDRAAAMAAKAEGPPLTEEATMLLAGQKTFAQQTEPQLLEASARNLPPRADVGRAPDPGLAYDVLAGNTLGAFAALSAADQGSSQFTSGGDERGQAGFATLSKEGQDRQDGQDVGKEMSASDFFALTANSTEGVDRSFVSGSSGSLLATTSSAKGADQNVHEVLNQAQLLANRGGGEATIRLNPEGLGELRLKVMVVNGHVNLEMAAQTREAKQLIESSLHDLRSSLSAHQLTVDHIKVDVGNQASTNSNGQQQQKGFEFQQDQGRDQARQMMQQFQQDTAGRRDPFFEMPSIKAYQRRQQPAPIPPAGTEQASRRYLGEGRGGRMSIVA